MKPAKAAARAVELTGVARKLYFKAHGAGYWTDLRAALNRIGIHRPAPDAALRAQQETVQRRITTAVDVRAVVAQKRAALLAHRSQVGSSLAARLPAELFADVFGVETFIRAYDSTGTDTPEDDLFHGVW